MERVVGARISPHHGSTLSALASFLALRLHSKHKNCSKPCFLFVFSLTNPPTANEVVAFFNLVEQTPGYSEYKNVCLLFLRLFIHCT